MTERTAEFSDRYAADFDAIYGTKNTPLHRVVNALFRRSMRTRYLLSLEGCHPVAGRSVLDIGCGPGHYSVELARRGAARVRGLDSSDGMLERARAEAARAGVRDVCTFERADFFRDEIRERFDYVLAMGFMDYVARPAATIRKALGLATSRAFFSFPLAGGGLAWQRRLRYRARGDLYLYTEAQVRGLFADMPVQRLDVRAIDRDLFVAAHIAGAR
jgi:2-polyprenyl-3-methyl-5-hydroxy-6-metoxy-1,4-benzoquinol methylase